MQGSDDPPAICLPSLSSLTSFLLGQGDLILLPSILATPGADELPGGCSRSPGQALLGSGGSHPLSWDQAGASEALVGQAGWWVSLFSPGVGLLILTTGAESEGGKQGSLIRGRKGYWHSPPPPNEDIHDWPLLLPDFMLLLEEPC